MIYDSFFGFSSEPFGVTPNPHFLYLSRAHEEALAHLEFGISEDRGFIMLTGEVGSGKTTLMRYFIDKLDNTVHTSVVLNPKAEPLELLKLITRDFGIECAADTHAGLMECLNTFLVQAYEKGEKAVIFIDEAQDMSPESLEFIRLLSNFETSTRKLLQLVLIGQPELNTLVSEDGLRQLDQRISVRYHIGPLKKEEVGKYISHRLSAVGSGMIFPQKTVNSLFRYSKGLPRLINRACDRILLNAYSEGALSIDRRISVNALKELGFRDRTKTVYGSLAAMLILVVFIAGPGRKVAAPLKIMNIMPSKEMGSSGRFNIDKDGMVAASDPADSGDAAMLTLMQIYGDRDVPLSADARRIAAEKGYGLYAFSGPWKKLEILNSPAVLKLKKDNGQKTVLLLWILGMDAVIFDPLSGRAIMPVEELKKDVLEIVILWKNKYNGTDRISLLQKDLSSRGLLSDYQDGVLDKKTGHALQRLQKSRGIRMSGRLDEQTMIILSRDSRTPELYPQEIRRSRGKRSDKTESIQRGKQ